MTNKILQFWNYSPTNIYNAICVRRGDKTHAIPHSNAQSNSTHPYTMSWQKLYKHYYSFWRLKLPQQEHQLKLMLSTTTMQPLWTASLKISFQAYYVHKLTCSHPFHASHSAEPCIPITSVDQVRGRLKNYNHTLILVFNDKLNYTYTSSIMGPDDITHSFIYLFR